MSPSKPVPDPASPVLQAHRQRVAGYRKALEDLHRMHEESHALWSRIVLLARSPDADARDELDLLHDQAYGLSARIAQLREESFGEISYEARLRISSEVESIHPSRLAPPPGLLETR